MEENKIRNIITEVIPGSIGEELELKPGDQLVSINGNEIKDFIDYKFLISDENIVIEIIKNNNELHEYEFIKEYDEDLGVVFENPLLDKIKTCNNKCVFCFIDQLPKGMRKTLYLKDDDTRLSFLHGNFITLTNLNEEEINRIIKYRISPIKVSVHTTDLEIRKYMLGNKNIRNLLDVLKKLSKANIIIDCQIVLCRNINDGKNLDNTVYDLVNLYPNVRSIAVVPVGLTKYREKLKKLEAYDKESALSVINQINVLQKKYLKKINTRFVYAADEFYILGKKQLPPYKSYEGFYQIENGVGLIRFFEEEINNTLNKKINFEVTNKKMKIITGTAAFEFMKKIANKINSELGSEIEAVPIINKFFGEKITVSGLITGQDIINQLKNSDDKSDIIIPKNMLKDNQQIFLDDITVSELEDKLNVEVHICEINGDKLIETIRK